VLAGIIMIPMLTVVANITGILSGWLAVKSVLPVTDADFIYGARAFWHPFDAWYSVIKGFAFAVCITIISCYQGFSTEQGAEGVGKSTTGAVVASCVMILLLDTLLAKLLLH
jgi:phospholipid/cholesterol/gamma-HCH transport system permease protein